MILLNTFLFIALLLKINIVCWQSISDRTSTDALELCLLRVCRLYFHNEDIITIFLKNSVSSEQLIVLLQKELSWTISITHLNNIFSFYYKNGMISKSSSGILYIGGNELGNTFLNLNPEKRYIIIGVDPNITAADICEYLFSENIRKAQILIQDNAQTSIQKIYFCKNYPRNRSGFESWGLCSNGIILSSSKTTMWQRPKKSIIKTNYVLTSPYAINLENMSVHTSDYYDSRYGAEVNMINGFAKWINMSVKYYRSEVYGDIFINGTSAGNFLQLQKGLFDMTIGGLGLTAQRSYYLDASNSHVHDKLIWCAPSILKDSNNKISIDMYTLILMPLFILVLLVILWHFAKKSEQEVSSYKTFSDALLFVTRIILGNAAYQMPRTTRVRILFINILFLNFYITAIFQSQMTSILANLNFVQKFESREDILENSLHLYFGPNTLRYFQSDADEILRQRYHTCNNFSMCLEKVAVGQDAALCAPALITESLRRSFETPNERTLNCFDEPISVPLAVLMKKDSGLKEKFDVFLGRIISAGIVRKWMADSVKAIDEVRLAKDPADGVLLKFHHLIPAFQFLLTCLGIAFVVFILEAATAIVSSIIQNSALNLMYRPE